MIAFVRGTVAQAAADHVVVDLGAVGPSTALPAPRDP